MNIDEFAISQTLEGGHSALRPVYDPARPATYSSEDEARGALMYITGSRDDSDEHRVVKRTVTDWTPAKVDAATDVCKCGHLRAEHSAPVDGVCVVTTEENIGDEGADRYADNCMKFERVQ